MIIEEAIVARLLHTAPVAAVVGQRIEPGKAPQRGDAPKIVFRRISADRQHTHDGPSGLVAARCQFDLLTASYTQGRTLANAVRVALDGFKGTMGTEGGGAGVAVSAVFLEDEDEIYDEELRLHWTRLDFVIWHAEAVE